MIIICICLVLLTFNLYLKKNKTVFIVSLLLMWAIMTFMTNNADEGIYLSRYHNSADWVFNSELLFQFLNTTCYKLGFSFVQYKGVIGFLYITLVGSTIWKLSKYPNLVLTLFFICPFPLNASQLRFGLASAIFIFGYRYLNIDNSEHKKGIFYRNDIKFIVTVLIATFIHSASLCWIILLVAKRFNVRQTVLFTIITNIFIYFFFNPNSMNWILEKIGAYQRISAYFSLAYQNSDFRHYGLTTITVLFVAIMTIISSYLCKKSKWAVNNEEIEKLLKFNIVSLVCLAFILRYTSEMYRPQEALFLLNYIVLLNAIPSNMLLKLKTKKTAMLVQLLVFLVVVGSFVAKIYLFNLDTVWKPMFFF